MQAASRKPVTECFVVLTETLALQVIHNPSPLLVM